MSTPSKKVVLRTSDAEIFEVAETVAQESPTIKNMIKDGRADTQIPLPDVTGKTLAKVIEYLEFHHGRDGHKPSDAEVKSFNSAFAKLNLGTLYDLIMAAKFLEIKSLLYLCCQTIADILKDKTLELLLIYFGILNDSTPEEQAEFRRENP